jgi:hypothetical protein
MLFSAIGRKGHLIAQLLFYEDYAERVPSIRVTAATARTRPPDFGVRAKNPG